MLRADGAASPLSIRLFGPFAAWVHGQPLRRLRFRKSQAVLALLALRHGGEVEREWLGGLLWPESQDSQALRNCLTDLRQALGPEAGRLGSPTTRTLCLDLNGATVDVLAFDAAVASGDPGALEEAVNLYRGPLLDGCAGEWLFQERQVREQAYLAARETLAAHAMARGDPGEAERHLRLVVAADPLREQAQRSLMELLATGGNYAAALLAYRELRQRLHRELSVEPDPETQTLFQRLRAEARSRADIGSPGNPAGDLSSSGLPLTAEVTRNAAPRGCRLPLQLTCFIGRQAEMAEVQQRLARHRLVTLTGPGGTGKTRLALHVAQHLQDRYPGGVWFVSLHDLTDRDLIPDQILLSLGLPRSLQGDPLERAAAFISQAPSLLVMDNFEHLAERGAAMVSKLLEQATSLTVLVTSRQRLGLVGEREFPVAPLPVPEPSRHREGAGSDGSLPPPTTCVPGRGSVLATLIQCPSVALFVDRAQAARPDFQVTAQNGEAVADLCRRLEGLPLAIELAAARTGVLTPQQMLARLDQRFELLVGRHRSPDPRHCSLRATLDWSYQLLSTELRRFLAHLSVFRGGWSLEAAEVVCVEPRALEYLEELLHCSLVVTEVVGDRMRYRLLETVREYGAEQLTTDEQSELAERHLAYYLSLAKETGPELGVKFPVLPEWLDQAEREHDNLRAALDWMVQSTAIQDWLQRVEDIHHPPLIILLVNFWQQRGHQAEGRRRLAEILAMPGAAVPSIPRAYLLHEAGSLAWQQGNLVAADALVQESLSICQNLGAKEGEVWCCDLLALVARDQGDYGRARAYYELTTAIARELGEEWEINIACALYGTGYTAYLEGDLTTAQLLLDQGLQMLRNLGDQSGKGINPWESIAWVYTHLGELSDARGDHSGAQALLEEGLTIMRESRSPWGPAYVQHKLGRVAQHQGLWSAAAAHFGESLAVWQQVGNQQGIVACAEGLAAVAAGQGEPERAARLLGAAAALRERRRIPLPPVDRADLDRLIAALQADLSEAEFAAAWAAGQAMPVEQVIVEALEEAPAISSSASAF